MDLRVKETGNGKGSIMIRLINSLQELIRKTPHLQAKGATSFSPEVLLAVQGIQTAVIQDGDRALIDYAKQFDGVTADFELLVTAREINEAYDQLPDALVTALTHAKENIEAFHRKQVFPNWADSPRDGVHYGVDFLPIESVGLYVPGGRAVYPSTVLMDAVPARLAGVSKIVLTTPTQKDGSVHPAILAAADICGVDTIVKSGGAQAVFALAYGTETVPKVDKIVGPGNKYVTLAKQLVYGTVDIDKPAGPSEVLVVIDDVKYASFAAAEILAQCEHDPDASGYVVTTSQDVAKAVEAQVSALFPMCKRQSIIAEALQNSFICVLPQDSLMEGVNRLASEHLVLLVDSPESLLKEVRNAGSVFLGPYTPVALGDYYAGPNHVLPTAGTARFASPLGVLDFLKYRSYLSYSKEALRKTQEDMKILTEFEELDAHYLTVARRLSDQ